MTRPSPLLIGALAAAVLVVGVEVYFVARPRRRPEPAAPRDRREEPRPAQPTAPPPAIPPAPALRRAAPPPAAPSVEPPAAAAPEVANARRRGLRLAEHNQRLIEQADEKAFQVLNLPEGTRGAIRQINEEYGRKTSALLQAAPDDSPAAPQLGLSVANNGDAERARRAAIEGLLGPDAAMAFSQAEHVAARHLRRASLREWAEQEQANAPAPPAAPSN